MNEKKEYFYRKELKSLRKEKERLQEQVHFLEKNLNATLASKSWKVTEPLRKVSSFFQKKKDEPEKSVLANHAYDYHTLIPYESEYQENIDFSGYNPLVKTIAFYLPQYHTFQENDAWWGKGFTEWTNTKSSTPSFDGHYIPREPHDDFGYYCLEDIDTIKKQVNLAKQHKIYGFAFYYYWFSGKRLMEKPVDLFLKHSEIDFPFLLCWANENWTRAWDGLDKEVLIQQEYKEQDPNNFIKDIQKYLLDKRYIRVNGKPIIMVYNPSAIPNFETVCEKWRETAKKLGIGEILIWSRTEVGKFDDQNTSFVDAEFDFAPHGFSLPNDTITGINNAANVVNYSKLIHHLWETYEKHYPLKPFHYSVMMGWDNSARRKKNFKIFYHYSLHAFYLWTTMVMKKMYENDFQNTFLFVNAWNEWCEGTYLEPDKKFGYANINTLSKAICGIPLSADFKILNQKSTNIDNLEKIAVQCHIYYVDLLEEILEQLKYIPYSYDLFLSTDSNEKKQEIEMILKKYEISCVSILVHKNIGRDVLPMLIQMKPVIENYTYFLHLHTKKSKTLTGGTEWRKYLYYHLLGSKDNLLEILSLFHENKHLGLLYPTPHPSSFYQLVNPKGSIGGNQRMLEQLFQTLDIPLEDIKMDMTFPTGTMFWSRTEAIKDLFFKFDEKQFSSEDGQLDGTYAHAVERCFDALAKKNGFEVIEIINQHTNN